MQLASEALSARERFVTHLKRGDDAEAMRAVLSVGASAGGARAKALISYNQQTGEIRSGQIDAGPGFEHWLLKLDGVSDNRDKGLADPQGWGAIEYAYSLMARAAGRSRRSATSTTAPLAATATSRHCWSSAN